MFDFLIVGYRHFFVFLYEHVGFALAILLTSLISSFLVKPIAKVVAKIVKRQAAYEAVLNPLVAKINASGKNGGEKQFLLQELYRRYSYSPIYATRKVLPMFVQMPLLFLTYYMLQGADVLNGVSFLCFKDLGSPDALLPFDINLLPFLMTGINILAIYATLSFTRQDRIQTIVVALLFLWLLYSANSALMIYWTLNNFFTCVKTLAEEHWSGWRLLRGRLKWLVDGGAWSVLSHHVVDIWQEYALSIIFVDLLFAIYSVVMMKYNVGIMSNELYVFFILSVMFSVGALGGLALSFWKIYENKHSKKFAVLCVGTIFIEFLSVVVIMADNYLNLNFLSGRRVEFNVVIFCLSILASLLALFVLRRNLQLHKEKLSGLLAEVLVYVIAIVAFSVHFLLASPDLGLTITGSFLLPVLFVSPFVVMCVLFVALLRGIVDSKFIVRAIFAFFIVFYVTPMVATGDILYAISYHTSILYLFVIISLFLVMKCAKRNKQWFCSFLLLFSMAIVAMGIWNYVETTKNNMIKADVETKRDLALKNCSVSNKRNVYFFVYDGCPNGILLDYFGTYNPKEFLMEKGFNVYTNTYSSGGATTKTLSDFFDVFDSRQSNEFQIILGENDCMKFLKKQGYRLDYIIGSLIMKHTNGKEIGDFYFPYVTDRTHFNNVLNLWDMILAGYINPLGDCKPLDYTVEEWWRIKEERMVQNDKKPIFLYSHADLPSHACHFPNNANVRQNVNKLKSLLSKMQGCLERDLAMVKNWDDSIVVFMSDHGHYITGKFDTSPLSLLDVYGNQIAVKWPKGYVPTMDVSYSRNVLLEVLICLTGDKTLARFKHSNKTRRGHPRMWPDMPDGAIDNGVIQVGPAKGRNLFEAVKEELDALKW